MQRKKLNEIAYTIVGVLEGIDQEQERAEKHLVLNTPNLRKSIAQLLASNLQLGKKDTVYLINEVLKDYEEDCECEKKEGEKKEGESESNRTLGEGDD
jgi:hypothetical protein